MRHPPPEVLATWPTPNYVDPETRGPALVIVELIAVSISTICLALRLYVKGRVLRSIDWDDWLIIGAALFGAGVTTCVVLASSKYGWDIHIWDVPPAKGIPSRQVSFAAQVLFILSTWLSKISMFVSYLRLAPRGSWFRRLAIVGIWITALANFAFLISLLAQCRPVSSYWNLMRYPQDCINEAPSLLSHSVVTATLDLFVWALPLPTLYHTKLPLSQRIALIGLFSFGLVVVFASCIRIYWVHYVLQETYDVTWHGFQLWLWTAVEVQLGLICGCVPWLKSLFKFWRTGQTVTESSGRTHSDGQRTVATQRNTVISVDNRGKSWTGERPDKAEYIDLERSSAGGDSQTGLRFSEPEPARLSPTKATHWG